MAHVFCEAAQKAGAHPQREKASLLQPRSDTDGLLQRASLDRPAVVWIPHGEDLAQSGTSRSLLASDQRPETPAQDDDSTEPGRIRDTREDVPRHTQEVLSDWHPFNPSGFRQPRRRVV